MRKEAIFHIMGETALVNAVIMELFQSYHNYRVVVSTTQREVVEKDGIKTSFFHFVQFRELENPFPEFGRRYWNNMISSGASGLL